MERFGEKRVNLANVYSLKNFRARQLIEDGKYLISSGDLDAAIETFQKSLELDPLAEAYTYLGWILSLKGYWNEAIELCHKAIALDPDFGNPYNDIGSYLIQMKRYEEAIPWLEKAKEIPRYELRHFPYLNLGRIYSALGEIDKAIEEFETALEMVPEHQEARNVLEQLQKLKTEEVNASH